MSWFVPNSIDGEWWITDGQVEFADGDVGDMNHEGYVVDRLVRQVLESAGIDHDDEFAQLPPDLSRKSAAPILDELLQHLIPDPIERAGAVRVVLDFQTPDPRDYAIQWWGWIRLASNNVQMWEMTSKSLKSLADGISSAYDNSGGYADDDGEDALDAEEFNVEVSSTGKFYRDVPYIVLRQHKPAALREYEAY